jgi:hypothetical protein
VEVGGAAAKKGHGHPQHPRVLRSMTRTVKWSISWTQKSNTRVAVSHRGTDVVESQVGGGPAVQDGVSCKPCKPVVDDVEGALTSEKGARGETKRTSSDTNKKRAEGDLQRKTNRG